MSDPEAREKQSSRESLTSDSVKYETGPDGGQEVSMSVEWNGVSTTHSPLVSPSHTHARTHTHTVSKHTHTRSVNTVHTQYAHIHSVHTHYRAHIHREHTLHTLHSAHKEV